MDQVFIHPCRMIAKACGIGERTVYRWIKYHRLPVFHTPSGKVATSVGLLEQWARERMEREAQEPRNGGGNRRGHEAVKRWSVRLKRIKSVEG